MKKNDFISLRAERIYNAINNSFEFPGKAETLDVLARIKDPLSLLEAITKLRSNNAIIGLICDDLRDLDQAVLHMEFDPETAPAAKKLQPKFIDRLTAPMTALAAKKRQVKSVELPTVANSATVEPAKETAKAETAKAETAKAETAKAETAKAETAKAETAKAETAKAETAKESAKESAKDGAEATVAIIDEPAAKGSDPLDFDFMDDPKPAAEPAKTEPAKAPEADDTALKAVTVDDIRALAIKAAKAGKMAAVTTYLKAAGVPKVQDLDPSKFADFISAMKKAGV